MWKKLNQEQKRPYIKLSLKAKLAYREYIDRVRVTDVKEPSFFDKPKRRLTGARVGRPRKDILISSSDD